MSFFVNWSLIIQVIVRNAGNSDVGVVHVLGLDDTVLSEVFDVTGMWAETPVTRSTHFFNYCYITTKYIFLNVDRRLAHAYSTSRKIKLQFRSVYDIKR